MKDSLGDRMKKYEVACRSILPPRMPVILRVDGKAFHTWTRGCQKPFDEKLIAAMNNVAKALCSNIQGAQFAFVQSDEISVLIHGYKKFSSEVWFKGQVQKMASISAAIASVTMTQESYSVFGKTKPALFDSRVFILPEADVNNYFLWRQNDWTRNSVQMLARKHYSQKQCHRKNNSELQEMIHQKGENWNDLPIYLKRGRCIVKEKFIADTKKGPVERSRWSIDNEIPRFSEGDYVDKYLVLEEE